MSLKDLPTLAELQATPRASQKGLPTVLRRQERIKSKQVQEDAFRKAVWARDGGKSRASGKPLGRSGTSPERVGDVHHVLKRSTHPEGKWKLSRGILLSRLEHKLAETVCPNDPSHFLLEISGPEDLGKPQLFTWRDVQGVILKTRLG